MADSTSENGNGNGGSELDGLRQQASQEAIDKILEDLRAAIRNAQEIEFAIKAARQSGANISAEDIQKSKDAEDQKRKSVIKTILAIQEGSTTSSADQVQGAINNEFGVALIKKIGETIELDEITPQATPEIFDIIKKAIDGEITDFEGLKIAYQSSPLSHSSSALAEQARGAFRDIGRAYAPEPQVDAVFRSPAEAQVEGPIIVNEDSSEEAEMLNPVLRRRRHTMSDNEDQRRALAESGFDPVSYAIFDQNWSQGYSTYFEQTPEDRARIRKFYDVNEFTAWTKIQIIKTIDPSLLSPEVENLLLNGQGGIPQVNEAHRRLDPLLKKLQKDGKFTEELRLKASKDMQDDIVTTFGTIYQSLSDKSPKELFEEYERRGYWEAPEVVFDKMTKLFEQIIKQSDLKGGLDENFKFFMPAYQKEAVIRRTKEGKEFYPTSSTIGYEEVSLQNFLRGTYTLAEHMRNTLKYVSNIKSISLRTPDKEKNGGYWAQMKNYADELESTDIDTIMQLPGADMFNSAHQLYVHHVQEELARTNWTHEEATFSRDVQNVFDKMQQKVLNELEELFPDRNDHERRLAINIGTGIARGVMLTEVEAAAWADPVFALDDWSARTTSYYTTDAHSLQALNPIHAMFFQVKFQGWSQLLFLPVSYNKKRSWGDLVYDHKKLWKKAEQYKKAYQAGTNAYKTDGKRKRPDEEKLFIELMPNISRVGGYHSTHGLRTQIPLNEGHYVYKTKIDDDGNEYMTNKTDYLKTWKALEGIGFESVYHYADIIIGKDTAFLGLSGGNTKERDQLFTYLFDKFIKNDKSSIKTLSQEVNRLRHDKEVTRLVDDLYKDNRLYMDRDEAIEVEIYQRILHRALAGILAQRLPAKFAILERSRMTKNGEYAWRRLRQNTNLSPAEFSAALADISLVQTKKRLETSEMMRAYLEQNVKKGENHVLADLPIDNYFIDESILSDYLKHKLKGIDDGRISNAIKVYRELDKLYLKNDDVLDRYAQLLRRHDCRGKETMERGFPFQIAAEEIANEFCNYSATGPKTLPRLLFDLDLAEKSVSDTIGGWLSLLKKTAAHPGDMSKLGEGLKTVQRGLAETTNSERGYNVVHFLAQQAVTYFKKDTAARNIFTQFFRIGKKNSIAAEALGPALTREVWEWEVSDIRQFALMLEKDGALSKDGRAYEKTPNTYKMDRIIHIPGTNIHFKAGKKHGIKPDYDFSTKDLLKKSGGTYRHVVYEMLNKYIPLFVALLLYQYIRKAFEESTGEEQKH